MGKKVPVLLAFIMILSSLSVQAFAVARSFEDVPESHWANEAIEYVINKGLFSGTSATTFAPESTMTRGMLWVVLARMDGVDVGKTNPWYQKGLEWAKTNNISDGTNPNNNITREQFASMLYRFAEHSGISIATNESVLSGFTDKGMISSYAVAPMSWAVTNGIISGTTTTTVSPQGNATRAQVAMMLMRYDQKFGDGKQPVTPVEPDDDYTLNFATERTEIKVGETLTGLCNAVPFSYTSGLNIAFTSSDNSIATVNKDEDATYMQTCYIKGVGPGTVTITATDSTGKTANWEITVVGDSSSEPVESSVENIEIRDEIIELTNDIRAEAGVAAVTKSDKLMEAAQIRAAECAEMGNLNNHNRPNGDPGLYVLKDVGYDYISCGENLIEVVQSVLKNDYANRAVSGWTNSSGHYRVMTASDVSEIGVGVVLHGNSVYCCMIVAKPK